MVPETFFCLLVSTVRISGDSCTSSKGYFDG
jgi:hypothetical protein